MRDSNRINKICDMLKACWHMVPDWRFMQLICNLQNIIGDEGYYLEDNEVMEKIKEMMNGINVMRR